MIDYPAARAVAMVAQTGSFEAAAKALAVTPSAISQRIKQLEDRLGVVLIARGTPCTATRKGAALCRHIEQVGLLEKELAAELPALELNQDRVTLSVATNADSLATWFLKAVAPFGEKSDVLFNIALDDQEHTADWLARGRVVAAVTSFKNPVPGCRVIPLGKLRYHATASPAFVKRYFAKGVTAKTLSEAPGLIFNQKDRLQHRWIRQVLGRAVAFPAHWLPATQSFVDAALLGMGWGMNPALLIREHLATRRLVELAPGAVLDVPLYWQVSRVAADRLSALTQNVVTTARKELLA
ncbi:LysR family transcriptional regulator (chromosome initiation inhibitor) [Rhizomicrobium palustre]|uniref:LysR family transcriptional regulator (Chromosome initiation inhibitor) n=1 Tax=Rhizomicrobium palustre TaxID=189966 RepID=A0A846MUG3_9PROT|nr:LysR family transcriptional regulator ArgP [Rhizomicrobium palustre]NIK86993.1 LysR family transcriptional regulator (chromosome initiation inhibitor) [Rhizomicrobium palustre]